ncbi:DP transcription factor [Volvox carteri f. nagariensis]|uniref:DP transcription factor n=2 Tax=Volvox carteri f. nagariensis TaxID=3068 RepID=D8U8R9_VOLCA|nr:DP transcription factor [Volvox carteri f. nagariensis]EFJ43853.1 DP transcription factor [Volvox carteri f. nagariensis]|eukprot:XP_002955099.1 DP transcription factor [Volvox carteri f. nagariensis]
MSEQQQQQQQQRLERPGQAQVQDPLGTQDRAHFVQELHELGLLEFAEEVNFSRLTEAPGDVGLSSASRPGAVGHNNPPPQPTQPNDIHQCHLKNQMSDVATAHAIQVLHLAKRRKTSRGADVSSSRSGSKGLRHFSMKVCEKVEAKGRTTYNEVADELVSEMSKMEAANKNGQYDEKNIRRRVYDAINVLMAMDIIQKEKKEIMWKGFPRLGNHSLEKLKADRLARIKEVEQKQLYLQDMIEQQKALKKLLERSAARGNAATGTQLFLPFILVQAKPDATVEVKISEDMMDVQFDFYSSPFQIHDDSHVLKKMVEHQARQQQQQVQQPPFTNPLAAGGLVLHWQPPNGVAAGLQGLSPMPDPALAHLAVAAAQAPGNPLAYNYPTAAAAAAAYYHQQHQLLQQQQQQQQGQQQQKQPPAQAAAVGQQQGQGHQQQGQTGIQVPSSQQQKQPQQKQQHLQQQQQQQQHLQQQHLQQQHLQEHQEQQHQEQHQQSQQQQQQHHHQGSHHPAAQQQQAQQQLQQQHHHHHHLQQQQQQFQTLQALQQQIQHAHASLPGLALPPLGPPLALPKGSGPPSRLPPPYGLAHSGSGPPSQHPPVVSQLVGQLTASLPSGSGSLLPPLSFGGIGAQSQHPLAAMAQLPPPLPPPGQLLTMAHMPPALAAALAPPQPPAMRQGSMPPPPPPQQQTGGVSQPASGSEAPLQHAGIGQLGGPAPSTAFPLVA